MSEKLNRANRILDRACKQADLDPVAVRVAMVNAIKDKTRQTAGKPWYECRRAARGKAETVLL